MAQGHTEAVLGSIRHVDLCWARSGVSRSPRPHSSASGAPRSEGEPSRNCVGMAGHSGEVASPQDSRSTSPLTRPPDFSHQGEGAPCGQTQLLQGNRKFGFLLQKWLLLAWSGQTHKHVNEAHLLWVSLEFWPRSCGLSSRRPNTSLHRNKNNFEMQNREHGSHLETISSKISYIDKCAVFMREH